jgi:DNA-binding NarL/FixJ family response regulator
MDTGKLINLFIVDDNKVFSMALKSDIETEFPKMKIKIHLFETGEKCMEHYVQVIPELVILDYHLNSKYPDAADGIKVLDWIKKKDINTDVIMLTSEDKIDIAIKSFLHGASDYVVKSETQFKKINYSLYNLFKIAKAKNDLKSYKRITMIILSVISLVIAGAIVTQFYDFSLLK